MTKRDFIIIADSIAKIEDKDKREFVLTWFIQNVTTKENGHALFDKGKFIKQFNATLKSP